MWRMSLIRFALWMQPLTQTWQIQLTCCINQTQYIDIAARNEAQRQSITKFHADRLAEGIEETDEQSAVNWVNQYAASYPQAAPFPSEFGDALYQSAYHGTPHTFDKFSLDAIGTGEGAQAYGWGLYFAGKKEVGEYYRKALSRNNVWIYDGEEITSRSDYRLYAALGFITLQYGQSVEEAVADSIESLRGPPLSHKGLNDGADGMYTRAADTLESIDTKKLSEKGNLYQVDLPEDNVLLDWDKPLSEQSDEVKAALDVNEKAEVKQTKSGDSIILSDMAGNRVVVSVDKDTKAFRVQSDKENIYGIMLNRHAVSEGQAIRVAKKWMQGAAYSGEAAYDSLVSKFSKNGVRTLVEEGLITSRQALTMPDDVVYARAASLYLNSLGIKGIRYLDGTSRGTAGDTHNYVIWDEDAVTVEAVNDELVQAAGGGTLYQGMTREMAQRNDIPVLGKDKVEEMLERLWNRQREYYREDGLKSWRDLIPNYGVEEVALVADSEYDIYSRYFQNLPEDMYAVDVLRMYEGGTLPDKTQKAELTKQVEVKETGAKPSKTVYSQKVPSMSATRVRNAWKVAGQRVTKGNKNKVNKARLAILVEHNARDILADLGVESKELNKKLRAWSNWNAEATNTQSRLNSGKEAAQQWWGISNVSYLSQASISPNSVSRLVKSIDAPAKSWATPDGESLRRYIMRTMLGIDTGISYADLNFIVESTLKPLGQYNSQRQEIKIRANSQHTVAHEIGHYLDYKWAIEASGYSSNPASDLSLTKGVISERTSSEREQWMSRFKEFVFDLGDRAQISSEYHQRNAEVFARFVDQFLRWTEAKAGVRQWGESHYTDKFNGSDYVRFVGLLQEKAYVDLVDGNPLDPAAQTLFQTTQSAQPMFFSQMQRVLDTKLPNKGTAQSFKQAVQAFATKGEFKKEELEVSGVIEWLSEQEGKLTKSEVLDYLAANEIQVKEVTKGDGVLDELMKDEEEAYDAMLSAISEKKPSDEIAKLQEKYDSLHEENQGKVDSLDTKFASYQLPGGENYRELLMMLPDRPVDVSGYKVDSVKYDDGEVRFFAVTPNTRSHGYTTEAEAQQALERTTPVTVEAAASEGRYKGAHYDEANILAHIRFNERTDAEGKRVMFIEEVQSDWHQAGRKKGYAGGAEAFMKENVAKYKALKAKSPELFTDMPDPKSDKLQNAIYSAGTPDQLTAYGHTVEDAYTNLFDHLARRDAKAKGINPYPHKEVDVVPDAPFKTSWPLLSMKRAIRYAAENGFDSVAWTTGEQQAERYDLSKQLDNVTAERSVVGHNKGDYWLEATDNDGNKVMRYFVNPDKLSDHVGKDLAEKIIADNGGTYSGLDLKVGGEGMASFYDKMLPSTVNKYVKKWGGRVGEASVPTVHDASGNTPFESREKAVAVLSAGGEIYGVRDGQEELILSKEELDGLEEDYGAFDSFVLGDEQPSVTVHSLDITPQMQDAVMQGQPLFQEKRGAMHVPLGGVFNNKTLIEYFKGADISTPLHELGHYFLEVTADMATRGASERASTDMGTILNWMKVDSLESWNAMSIEQKRAHHELFADTFLTYLKEGKAPSVKMKGVFRRFKAWLKEVWSRLPWKSDINPELRQVFDRMLATEEEIEVAKMDAGMDAMDQESLGYSDAKYAKYIKDIAESGELAKEELLAKAMVTLKKEASEIKKALRAEISEEVNSLPVYRAWNFLAYGTPPDEENAIDHVRLDTNALREMYGDEPGSLARQLPVGKYGLVSNGTGKVPSIHPDAIASQMGYDSGDALVRALAGAEKKADLINRLADERLMERYADIYSEKGMKRSAMDAVHSEKRALIARAEMIAINKQAGFDVPSRANIRAFAANKIDGLKVHEIHPNSYLVAERKAVRKAMEAINEGDVTAAAEQKQVQVLQQALYMEARDAQKEAEAIYRHNKKLEKKSVQKNIAPDAVAQINAFHDKYEFRKVPLKELEGRETLAQWVAEQEAIGFEPTVDQSLLDKGKNYKLLTMGELRAVNDAIRQIEYMGRNEKKLMLMMEQALRDEVIVDIEDSIADNFLKKQKPSDIVSEGREFEKARSLGRDVWAGHRKLSSLMRQMDGYKDGGLMWRLFIKTANDANAEEVLENQKAGASMLELFKPYMGAGEQLKKAGEYAAARAGADVELGSKLNKKVYIPAIGLSLTLEERIAVALNMGAEVNVERLMAGGIHKTGSISLEQIQAITDTLSEEDWTFIRGVGKLMESRWDDMVKLQKDLSGDTVEPKVRIPVVTKFGTFDGWYFPIAFSDRKSVRQSAEDIVKEMNDGLYMRTQTQQGHFKKTVEGRVERPIAIDLGVITEHMGKVNHDLAWRKWLIDSRIIF